MARVIAIVQARMGSRRLPGKVMLKLLGRTVVEHCIRRVSRAASVNEIIIATSRHVADDIIEQEGSRLGCQVFRGSEKDVLERFYLAAKSVKALANDIIVRITADCPLFDGVLLEEMLTRFIEQGKLTDYLSNTLKRSYPRGLDSEIFYFSLLEKAHNNAISAYEREHVTPYIYQNSQIFNLDSVENSIDLSDYRWTLDVNEDWQLISTIFNALGENAETEQILQYLCDNPQIAQLNAHIKQKIR